MNEDRITQLLAENEELKKDIENLAKTSKTLVDREIDLRKAYENLKCESEEKSDAILTVAHQLRTPLTSMRWALRSLSDQEHGTLSEEQLSILKLTHASIEHMSALIETLIQVDLLEYGKTELSLAEGRIEKLLETIMNELQIIADEHNVALTSSFADNARDFSFDAKKMYNAFINLLDNAIKYTQEGGSVTVATTYTNTHAVIKIIDTGIGIMDKDVPYIFKKFSRFKNAQDIETYGNGLGLYITKKIIEEHKGTIDFQHNMPKGSIFCVMIPL